VSCIMFGEFTVSCIMSGEFIVSCITRQSQSAEMRFQNTGCHAHKAI
jgi:hypothetical protein